MATRREAMAMLSWLEKPGEDNEGAAALKKMTSWELGDEEGSTSGEEEDGCNHGRAKLAEKGEGEVGDGLPAAAPGAGERRVEAVAE